MDRKEEILTILAEECAEVIIEISKIKRFGNDDKKLIREMADVACMIDLLHSDGMFTDEEFYKQMQMKQKKLHKWSNIFGDNNAV